MWNEVRAERVRRELLERVRAPLGSAQLLEEASALVHRVVPVDSSCWATFDPATTMITSTVAYALDEDVQALDRFLELEYATPGPLAFRTLRAERRTVAVLGVDDAHVPGAAAARAHDHLAPMGFRQELRWVLGTADAAFGGVGMMRSGNRPFTVDERAFLEQIAPLLASGLRASMVRGRAGQAASLAGPAILVFERGELASATADGHTLLEAIASLDRGAPGQPLVVRAVARAAAAGHTVCQRVFVPGYGPMTLRGAPLAPGNAVVAIEPSRPGELVTLVAEALALTSRERDVVDGVLRGLSTKDMAQALHLSPYTVQDHLKSIFEKASVDSRRELVSDIFFGFAAPRLGDGDARGR
ncbi:MAG: helix-turn-helix transcriptional regulator [Polyangiales bacterium]